MGSSGGAPIEVTTRCGRLRGDSDGRVATFKGIPYAAPPVGTRRFKPPAPMTPWTGVRDAFQFGPQSLQTSADLALMGDAAVIGLMFEPPQNTPNSEDCLYLNVWVPVGGGPHPVMFWCHSGGFFSGSGAMPHCDGTSLAATAQVVVVTVNHRLGLLGFLHLHELAGEAYSGSGNAGLLDLAAALTWVRDNIAAFGGDPHNVTLFGESGGGAKVGALMSMPRARGLFHRAIIQSGAWARYREPADATGVAGAVLEHLGLNPGDAQGLSDIPAERILEAQHVGMTRLIERPQPIDGSITDRHLGPVRDADVLPYHPRSLQALELSAHVPLLMGTNRDEGTFFLSADPGLHSLDEAGLLARVRGLLGDEAADVIESYRRLSPRATPTDWMIEIITDEIIRMPSIAQVERKLALGAAPVYMYLFAFETDVMGGRLRSPHGLEIPFAFDNVESDPFAGSDPRRIELSKVVSGAWTAFARSGQPSHPQLPEWPAYESQNRATMELDVVSRVLHDPERERRLIWRDLLQHP
jgi:para-nitrobenzyl esterase